MKKLMVVGCAAVGLSLIGASFAMAAGAGASAPAGQTPVLEIKAD